MTRFIYLCDTHLGTAAMGFTQQPDYPHQQSVLLDLLSAWIEEDGAIDFVVHGGDMIDAASPDLIDRAYSCYGALPVPVYLCLGNHDLTHPQAHQWWLSRAPTFFRGGTVDFQLDCPDVILHITPNQWGPVPYCWQDEQTAHFLPAQRQALEQRIQAAAGQTQVLVTHAPSRGLPTSQTGFDAPYHGAAPAFTEAITELATSTDRLRLVLSAHSHLNMHLHEDDVHYVSASSFVEAPFEFKLVECESDNLTMSTHSLVDRVPFPWRYDFAKTYVQGRPCDRHFPS